ncbi:MAG: molybdopterin-guanine dinucleotide biosynthesis protein B [Clostridia bacterium]|nr:molybdopterin-guanine dinucleotide biosynthesis protein B [Clostridia bacterium]
MKVFSVTGLTATGKTTTIEQIIKELKERGYSVGTVKEIHYDAFRIDTPGKNTYRHREAGADTVTARAHHETDIMYKGHMPIYDILKRYSEDYIILEGVRDAIVPEIALCKEDEQPELMPLTFAVSGVYANNHCGTYLGLPVINAQTDIKALVDLIIKKVPPLFYDIDPACCSKCGYDCRGLLAAILRGEKSYSDCVLSSNIVSLKINGKDIVMVPFVQNLLNNVILGVVSELNGYEKDGQIDITIKNNE